MSDATAPVPSKAEEAKPAEAKAPRRPGKWLRRARLTIFGLLLAFFALRVALQFLLPSVIHRTAAAYGLAADYERHEINLLGGDVGLWHLTIKPAEGGDAIVTVDYCRGDVSTWDLLMGRLLVRRLEAEGIELNVERTADGDIPLLTKMAERMKAKSAAAGKPVAVAAATTKPSEIDLTSPFQMDAFRVDRVRAHVRDKSVTPALDVNAELNLRMTDLRSPTRPITLDMDLTARPVLESLHVNAKARAGGKVLDGWTEITVSGFHPRTIAPYLKALGIKPEAYDLSGTCSAKVKTAASTRPSCLAAAASLYEVEVYADGHEALALDSLAIDADALGAREAAVKRLSIDGVRCNAERSAAGAMRVAGFEFTSPPAATTAPVVATASTMPASRAGFAWAVDELDLSRINAGFTDQGVSPAATLGVALDRFSLKHLTNDPKATTRPIEVAMSLATPGVARLVKLTGEMTPFADARSARLALEVEGLKPDALKPYLDAAGIGCAMKDASLTCAVDAVMRPGPGATQIADARLSGVKLTDGVDLLALSDVRVTGLVLGGPGDRVQVEAVELSGPALAARRRADGGTEGVGFFTKAATTRPVVMAAGAIAAAATQPAALPRVEIGRVRWKDLRVRFEDRSVTPAAAVATEDGGIEIDHLCIDLRPNAAAAERPATVKAWLKAPGLAGSLTLDGTVTPTANGPILDAQVSGDDLSASPAAGYLKAFGVEPTLANGTLRLRTHLGLQNTAEGMTGDFSLSDVTLSDNGHELAGLDVLKVNGLDLRGGKSQLGEVITERPRVHVTREKDGSFTVAGVHTVAKANAAPAAPVAASTKPASAPAPAEAFVLMTLGVKEATLHWTDKATAAPVDVTGTVTASIDNVALGGAPQEAQIDVSAALPGVAERVNVSGQVVPDAKSPAVRAEVNAEGLRAGPLAAYLPPGLKPELKDGRFRAKVDAHLAPEAKGRGNQMAVAVTELDYRDGPGVTTPLLRFDAANLKVSRFDPEGQAVAIDEISLAGLETQVRKGSDGLHAMGFGFVEAPPAAVATSQPVAAPTRMPAANPEFVAGAAAPTTAPAAADIARAVAAQRQKLPLITVGKLDLGARAVTFAEDGSAPIVLRDLSLVNRKPIEVLGDDAENRPAVELGLACKPSPFAQSLKVETKATPFALRPRVEVGLQAEGIKGDDLLAAYPQLKSSIDAAGLMDGRLAGNLVAEMKVDRRDLLHLDFSRAFEASFELKDLTLRNGDGPVLAGVGAVRSEAIHVDPKSGAVRAKSLEVTNLLASASREKDGLHALGIVIRPTTAPAAAPTSASSTQPVVVTAPPPSTKPAGGELRLDRFAISGADLKFVDNTLTPPLEVPITSIEIEARDLSSALLSDPNRSTRFSVLVNSGKVGLPPSRHKAASADGVDAATGLEQRELFSQVAASGKLSLAPRPVGWAKASVNGLELAALRGEANAAGFKLGGGTFDADVDARFREDGTADLRPRFEFTDLSVTEPPDGPVRHALQLPAPLDVVIGVLQDASGRITVPLHVPIKDSGVGYGAVTASAVGAFGGIVTKALASAPVKTVESVASLVGIKDIFGFHKKLAPLQPMTVPFDTGMAWTPAVDAFALPEEWVKRMRKQPEIRLVLKHDLSLADLDVIASRANPKATDVSALAYQLRQHKDELLKERALVAGQARGELGSGLDVPATVERLRQLDRELAANEDALDELYDLLRPGADRQTSRRTRAACLALGRARLEAVKGAILRANAELPNLKPENVVVMSPTFAPDEASPASVGAVTITPGGGKGTEKPGGAQAAAR